jgi:hypothetical protein
MRTIGIVGASRIGRALLARFTTAGHDIVLSNSRGPKGESRSSRLSAVRSISRLLFGCVAVLGAAGCAMPAEAAPPQAQAQQAHPLQDAADWRERMQKNHSADRSIEQQVRRLTKDLDLTPEQQDKVRQLSKERNDRIQKILDTAPPTLTHEAFTTQVHAISQEFHDAVNAILTPHELELMKAMVGRLDSGKEDRHAP